MGTPDFAVPSLERLAQHHEVTAVYCQPDKPRGRSRKLLPCPVKEKAVALGIPVFQPKRIRAKKWVALLQEQAPDLIVVAAFGQILSQKVLDVPRLTCVNVHASILPRWRGASPIHHAILTGDAETGVAIMKMELALDAGPVYSEARVPLTTETRRPALEADLAQLGADLLVDTIPKLEGTTPTQQDETLVTFAPIIGKDFGYMDPTTQSADAIARAVRAYEGWPSVVMRFRDQPVKIHTAKASPAEEAVTAGNIARVTKKTLHLACAENTWLQIDEIQPTGKKSQPIHAFINGYRPTPEESFTAMEKLDR